MSNFSPKATPIAVQLGPATPVLLIMIMLLILLFQVLGEQEHEQDQEHDAPATIGL